MYAHAQVNEMASATNLTGTVWSTYVTRDFGVKLMGVQKLDLNRTEN